MANNQLTTRIVLRNDTTSGWSAVENNKEYILLPGEVGIEFQTSGKVKMKIGDGKKTWAQLPYFGGDEGHVFELTVKKGEEHIGAPATETTAATGIYTVIGDTTVNKGDIAIVKEAIIAEDDLGTGTQKYQYTAYVYDGNHWKAMDGNYSADNVYFDEDFTFTTKIGTVQSLTNGSTTVAAAGKSMKQFFSGLFASEVNGGPNTSATNKGQPYVSITLKNNGSNVTSNTSYEVGTTFTPSYTASFEDGSYTYGPDPTGVTVTNWNVTSTGGETWNTTSGTGTEFTIGDDTSYSITATATHTAGSTPKSNLGNDKGTAISAGSKFKTSAVVSGYRALFGGGLTSTDRPNSAAIRSLSAFRPTATFAGSGETGKVSKGDPGFSIEIPVGSKQIVVALYGKTLKKALYTTAMGNDIFANGTLQEITATADNEIAVNGANNYTAKNYKVYSVAFDVPTESVGYIDCVIG